MEGKKGGRKMKEKNCNDDREKDNEKKSRQTKKDYKGLSKYPGRISVSYWLEQHFRRPMIA